MKRDRRKLETVPVSELANVVANRNGTFQGILAFMGVAPLPAFVKDATGRVLYLNRHAEEMFAVSVAEARGKTVPEMLGVTRREMAEGIERQDRKVLASRTPLIFVDHFREGPNPGSVGRFSTIKFRLHCDNDDAVIVTLVARMGPL